MPLLITAKMNLAQYEIKERQRLGWKLEVLGIHRSIILKIFIKFKVLRPVNIKNTIFWVLTPCNLVY
jgi:ribosomal protein L5